MYIIRHKTSLMPIRYKRCMSMSMHRCVGIYRYNGPALAGYHRYGLGIIIRPHVGISLLTSISAHLVIP